MTTVGERVIATYKTLKGALQLVLGAALVVVLQTGHAATLHDVAAKLGDHASRTWSIALAHAIVGSVTPRGLKVTTVALALDGVLTSLEGGRCAAAFDGVGGRSSSRAARSCPSSSSPLRATGTGRSSLHSS